jgi:hypothetical protein
MLRIKKKYKGNSPNASSLEDTPKPEYAPHKEEEPNEESRELFFSNHLSISPPAHMYPE